MITEMSQPQVFHLLQLKGAISLEMQGFKTKGGSAYAHAKRIYNLKGSRQKVHDWLEAMYQLQLRLKQYSSNYDAAVGKVDKSAVDYWEGAIQQTLEDIQELQA